MSDFQAEIAALHRRIEVSRERRAILDEIIEAREDAGVDVRPGLGNPEAEWEPFAYSDKRVPEPYSGAGTSCWCQNAYDTGFTGDAKIDAALKLHYDHWLEPDSIRRDYDHYAKHIPYLESVSRRPYCFRSKTKGLCRENGRVVWHEECEHARHRAPDTVKRMRWYIEQNCPASTHYVELAERIDRTGDTRPEMDNGAYRMVQWDEVEYEWHKRNPQADGRAYDAESCPRTRTRPSRLRVISRVEFWEDVVDAECAPIEAHVVGEFIAAFAVKPEPGEYTVSYDPTVLAEKAAAEASDALFAQVVDEEDDGWGRLTSANRVPRRKVRR